MSASRSLARAAFSVVCLSVSATAIATAAPAIQDITPQAKDNPTHAIVTAILMDRDRRGRPDDGTRVRFGATGLVRCGNMIGTAQLVLRHDVIVTAAHVLSGAGGGECVFVPGMGRGEPVPIATSTIRLGSRAPLSEPATRDWAVARLVQPVSAATPYGLASMGARPGTITLCAGGNGAPSRFGTETCAVRGVIKSSADGIRELAIDCSASPGSSGAALLSPGGAIAGIYVGYRSTNPEEAQAFSKTHYNFGITIDGPFRHALQAAVH